jgi:formamidopyrimidine-DNA glycosylase
MEDGQGWLLLHLGMSGSLRIVPWGTPVEKHDHFDLVLENGQLMRLRDPRRFGLVLWLDQLCHPLLDHLGVEPLGPDFTPEALYTLTRGRQLPVKQFIMDARRVVGVGNIYASESLFRARIDPRTPASQLSLARCGLLVRHIREILEQAIEAGGSSLRDFVHSDGQPGYFQQQYFVYGREGEPCRVCGKPVLQLRQGQRSTFWCGKCQKKRLSDP